MDQVYMLVLLFILPSSYNAKTYDGYRLIDIIPNSVAQHLQMTDILESNSNYDIWQSSHVPGRKTSVLVPPSLIYPLTVALKSINLTFEFNKLNVQRSIRKNKLENRRNMIQGFMRTGSSDHSFYRRYSQIQYWLARKVHYSDFATKEDIGQTTYGKKLTIIKISKNPSNPIIWIDAGIHAREWIAPASALYLIDKLLTPNSSLSSALNNYTFYILPLVNPDGYEFSHTTDRLWRKNRKFNPRRPLCRGVDLNRNFPYFWGNNGASDKPCNAIYRGSVPKSEKETQAITNYLEKIKLSVKMYLSLHAFGEYILYPYGYSKDAEHRNMNSLIRMGHFVGSELQAKHGRVYNIGTASDLLYAASGSSDDFMAGTLEIPYSYTIELPDQGTFGFVLPPTEITYVGEELVTIIKVFTYLLPEPDSRRIDDCIFAPDRRCTTD